MRCIAWAFVVVLAGACAGPTEDDERASSPSTVTPGVVEMPAPASPAAATAAPTPMPAQPAIYQLAIEPIDAKRGENGRGESVAATAPRALSIRADAWPGRALDPVLYIGQLHFHAYEYPRKGELRYVVADVAMLPAGAEVALQYGDDTRSRVVLSTSLEVPR